MTREELKVHCKKQIHQFERVEEIMPVTLNDCKRYEEHKLILELLEQTRWIPVSERLPKAGEYIGDGDVAKYYLVQNEYGDMMVARYTHSEYWEQIYKLKPIGDEIVAWRELPEPYVPDINVGNKNCILDKIRAEIEQLRLHKAQFITSDNKVCIDSQEVLNIIDKYRTEREEKYGRLDGRGAGKD